MSSAAVLIASWYVVLGARSSDGAMIARRPSVGSTRTSNGMLGLNVIADCRLFAFISRVKLSVRYAAGSMPVSLSEGVEEARLGGPSVMKDQWWRSEYVLPARSRYPGSRITSWVWPACSVACVETSWWAFTHCPVPAEAGSRWRRLTTDAWSTS